MTDHRPQSAHEAFLDGLSHHRVVAVIRHDDADIARDIATACIEAGLGFVEITLTTPDAIAIIADLTADPTPGTSIGAGTVMNVYQVDRALAARASFLVSPITEAGAIRAAKSAGIPLIPGASTATEIANAAALGAPVVKVFPAATLGQSFVSAIRSVMPGAPLMVSGGIAITEVSAWLDAGAYCVAVGSELNRIHAVGGRDAVIETLAATVTHHSSVRTPIQSGPST